MSLALVPEESAPTLDELAATARHEHQLAEGSALGLLHHAIACGEALNSARSLVAPGDWMDWCETNVAEIHFSSIVKYCRLARHRDYLEPRINDGTLRSRASAHISLRGIGHQHGASIVHAALRLDVSTERLRQLKDKGLTHRQIADEVGLSTRTISERFNPAARKKRIARATQRRREARRVRDALAQKERDNAVRKKGGVAADLYAAMRRHAVTAHGLIADSDDTEFCEEMRSVLSAIHSAEDAIVRALRLERQR